MPKYRPLFSFKALNQVSAGVPVIFERNPAITAVNRQAQAAGHTAIITLAVYDGAQDKFVYRYFEGHQPNVILPNGEIVIRPTLNTLLDQVDPRRPSSSLFLADNTNYIVVEIPNGQTRLLDLNDGSLVSPQSSMPALASWEIGVLSSDEYFRILRIGAE